tara:strand:- start:3460 stop:3903 length:444 start_codon:yes stop_codon:yes gene_type:complete
MKKYVDFYLDKFGSNDYYDIAMENGDCKKVEGLETSIIVSVLSNQRASETEIQESYYRSGWWGNLFSDYENGSKIWLLSQSSINNNTKNLLNEYINKCLNWLIIDGYLDKLDINVIQVDNNLVFTIKIIRYEKEDIRQFNLLEATIG